MTVDGPAPYPPEHGERFRWLPFPCGNPDRTPPEPVKVKRHDGTECDLWATLGMRRPAADPDDLGVSDWRPV